MAEPGGGAGGVPVYSYKVATASTIYTAVERILAALPHWRGVKGLRHNLLLAERWEVKYSQLGCTPGLRQCVNHIRGSKAVTVKALMVKTLRAHASGTDGGARALAGFLPSTHLLVPGEDVGCERSAFVAECREGAGEPQRPIWICKPTTGAHGKAILISDDYEEVLQYIDGFAVSSDETQGAGVGLQAAAKRRRPAAWLVQRYIQRPLLIHGRKFDIRALVCAMGDGRILWYDQWILRTCSQPYSLADLGNKIAHISNHCIQATSQEYSKHEEGNELFTGDLRRYLVGSRGEANGAAAFESIVEQMQDIVRSSMDAVSEIFEGEVAGFDSFQLLGYDFMVDEDYRVWLLECNGSPACAARLMPGFAAAVVDVAIRGYFPTPELDGLPAAGPTSTGQATADEARRIDGEFQLIHNVRRGP